MPSCPECGGFLRIVDQEWNPTLERWFPVYRCEKCGKIWRYGEVVGAKKFFLEKARDEYFRKSVEKYISDVIRRELKRRGGS